MTKPFQEIADAFKAETGCEMNIAFANAAEIQTQRGCGRFFGPAMRPAHGLVKVSWTEK